MRAAAASRKFGLDQMDLPNLKALDLTNQGVGAQDVCAMAPLLAASSLRVLKLGYNQLGDKGAAAVAMALEGQVFVAAPAFFYLFRFCFYLLFEGAART